MPELDLLQVIVLSLAVLAGLAVLLGKFGLHGKKLALVFGILGLSVVLSASFLVESEDLPESTSLDVAPSAVPNRPKITRTATLPKASIDQGFVSSDACRECHPAEHQSWHRTYHRSMTQEATPEAVVPPWEGILASRGRTYNLERRGDEFWVEMNDPVAEMMALDAKVDLAGRTDVPRREMKIAMTTGSHHHQTYWIQTEKGLFVQFPWVYHIKQDRWVFRTDSFIVPPHDAVQFNIWNTSCIGCHATGGQPRVATDTMHSSGELGISCEACHGPGAYHVQQQQIAAKGSSSITDVTINTDVVNPAKMPPEESARVCGQCHVLSERKRPEEFLATGDPYRAGQDNYLANRILQQPSDEPGTTESVGGIRDLTLFWPDGAVRAAGREFTGMMNSSCFLSGHGDTKITCISCHSLHDADPNKLIAEGMYTNQACTQCHTEERFSTQLSSHTHHAADSSGSSCYNCHMPRTSYALFNAARSHRIDSPVATRTVDGMRPNACNLCHLDKPMQWTATHLSEWYDRPLPDLSKEEEVVPASILWALRGDASQRAISAWHMRWSPATAVSESDWQAGLLAELLNDPYGAVRYLAYESLRRLPGWEDFDYDFDAPPSARDLASDEAHELWRNGTSDSMSKVRRLLSDMKTEGGIDWLKSHRDDRPITVLE